MNTKNVDGKLGFTACEVAACHLQPSQVAAAAAAAALFSALRGQNAACMELKHKIEEGSQENYRLIHPIFRRPQILKLLVQRPLMWRNRLPRFDKIIITCAIHEPTVFRTHNSRIHRAEE
jgi:hypothetical protein